MPLAQGHFRPRSSFRALPIVLATLGLLLAACAGGGTTAGATPPVATVASASSARPSPVLSPSPSPSPAAARTDGPALQVNDAATANPDLRPGPVGLPAGLAVESRTLLLPPGFSVEVIAGGLKTPRFMAFDSAGNLLVADTGIGAIYRYRSENGAILPTATPPEPLLQRGALAAPSNVALEQTTDGAFLYVGETAQVIRYRYSLEGALGPLELVIPNLPTEGHRTRTVAFGSDGKLYMAIGSSCNICAEADDRRAAITRYNRDGSGAERLAWGLRNPVGLAFQPGTGLLWATVNERDNQGNEIPPDLVTVIRTGANYGWPGCQPPRGTPQEGREDCSGVTPPTVAIQAHSAPLGLTFYNGTRFPEVYRGSIFVAQHGSWNRRPPAEPKLLQIQVDGPTPRAARDFLTGWQDANGRRWGRPAGVIAGPDGSLFVSDDQAGLIYRVSYGT